MPSRYYSGHTHDVKGKARAVDQEDVRHDGLDWQSLYRVSANWQSGNFAVTELLARAGKVAQPVEPSTPRSSLAGPDRPLTLVQSAANLIFTASRREDSEAVVRVYRCNTEQGSPRTQQVSQDVEEPHDPTKSRPIAELRSPRLSNSKATITELRVDVATPSAATSSVANLFVAYSDSTWSIFRVTCSLDHQEVVHLTPPASTTTPIVLASFHWPLVATCTADFHISLYQLGDSQQQPRLLKQMHSLTCHWPATISLAPFHVEGPRSKLGKRRRSSTEQQSQSRQPSTFRLTVAYCSPAYPHGWTLALQEIVLDLRKGAGGFSSRFATAPSHHAASRSRDNAAQRSAAPPLAITYDDPYLVVGSQDNHLEVYELRGDVAPAPLRLAHRRVLYGHMGSVLSVALEDGRCVSGSSDGSVMVWALADRPRRNKTRMEHVVTLRSDKQAGTGGIPTLSDLLARVRKEGMHPVPHAIKWVSTAYDRVLSVLGSEDEQVQVWSFTA